MLAVFPAKGNDQTAAEAMGDRLLCFVLLLDLHLQQKLRMER